MLAHAHLTCWQLRRQGFQFLQGLNLVELRELTAVARFIMDLADVTFKYNFSDLDMLMGKHWLYSLLLGTPDPRCVDADFFFEVHTTPNSSWRAGPSSACCAIRKRISCPSYTMSGRCPNWVVTGSITTSLWAL